MVLGLAPLVFPGCCFASPLPVFGGSTLAPGTSSSRPRAGEMDFVWHVAAFQRHPSRGGFKGQQKNGSLSGVLKQPGFETPSAGVLNGSLGLPLKAPGAAGGGSFPCQRFFPPSLSLQ